MSKYLDLSEAVLEQPSPRGVLGGTPGRRNIVLPETGELNGAHNQRVRLYATAAAPASAVAAHFFDRT
jgi:hypothetical protein